MSNIKHSFKNLKDIIVISGNDNLNNFSNKTISSLQGLYDESDFNNGLPYCEKIQLINKKYKSVICLVKDFVASNSIRCMGCDACSTDYTGVKALKCFHTGVCVSLGDAELNKIIQDFRKQYYLWYWLFETNEVNGNS